MSPSSNINRAPVYLGRVLGIVLHVYDFRGLISRNHYPGQRNKCFSVHLSSRLTKSICVRPCRRDFQAARYPDMGTQLDLNKTICKEGANGITGCPQRDGHSCCSGET